jgi:hypothetical protein
MVADKKRAKKDEFKQEAAEFAERKIYGRKRTQRRPGNRVAM